VDYNIDAAMDKEEAAIILEDARKFVERVQKAFDEMDR
jgi:uncharacterized protein (UPF0332 family)